MGERRARGAAEKEARRATIVAAAAELLERSEIEELTMAQIAAAAGLAKGTLYLYFGSKEALLLAVVLELLEAWSEEARAALGGLDTSTGAEASAEVARALVETLEARPMLGGLLSILHSVIERNVELEELTRFKRELLRVMAPIAEAIEGAVPGVAAGEGVAVLLHIDALIIGLTGLARPAPVADRALRAAELAPLRLDFGPELERAAAALLAGWSMTKRREE